MDFEALITQGVAMLSEFNLVVLLILFGICFISETVGLTVPYLLETVWLMGGYQVASGELSIWLLILLILVAQAGRQIGALALSRLGRVGSGPIERFITFLRTRTPLKKISESPALQKVNLYSPFAIAVGRFMWLRIPLTLLMGAKRKTKVLMLGVLISGIFYDALYVIFGAVVGKVFTLNSVQMVIIFTGGLTVLYIGTFVVQQIVSRLKNKKKKTPPPI
ncbi:hypothetical protein [Dehalococcoides sp.]|jgi:membrane-associated protein|uniref:hypothetical protein n=1 Tax=Dehalococcoides sp. TaxID=1966486 RepID=UPI003565007B